ncbi:HlyD family type I secretion periplasmic adaptor subunit [Francisella frigiditurris]|uniref:Membrane fusion protein (MFP) family protein n=1 Tax=Francisella frigiditurris TaxID=1542390 RepID=A0A1J0KTL3_9GAMM|nr:HlyD family type I secretion periplasmic adaptor subunit [Francisella frigiditurris]APC96534.1 type I secretion membrane fusion, HlyD family protein [Francisella frigiditurris]APC97120.1 type I secretion membrane fusion, HlyD family protein [Francisella frigiditurris]
MSKLLDFWKNRKTLAEEDNAKKDAYSFLPGVLEVTDKPPHPLMRKVLYCLIFLIVFVILWAAVSNIDIITSGQGKIIPSGDVKTIQSSEKGTVIGVNVENGQLVKKGDILMTLESDYTEADINKLQEDVEFYKLRIAREQTFYEMIKSNLREQIPYDKIKFDVPEGVTDQLDIEQSKRLLWQQWQSGIAKLMTLEATLDSKKTEQEISMNRTAQLEQTVKIIKEKTDAYANLLKKKAVSRMDYLETREKYLNTYYELETERKRDKQLEAEIAEARSNLESFKSETYLETLKSIRQDTKDLYTSEQELHKATTLNGKNQIKSPIDGIVHELKIHTIGAVVSPAEVLMQIVPLDQKLQAEVYVKNEDIGYLKSGQEAEVKVNTFPFAEYGVLHGTVEKISGDAIEDERLGLVYKLIVSLNDNTLHKDGESYKIVPGMAVVAEVKTGTRRVIDFFTEPLTRGIDNSLRER